MKPSEVSFLHQPAEALMANEALVHFMRMHQFSDLNAMLSAYSAEELLNQKGFDYHCLVALYKLLEVNGCKWMLRE